MTGHVIARTYERALDVALDGAEVLVQELQPPRGNLALFEHVF
jgi:hypothetical protein